MIEEFKELVYIFSIMLNYLLMMILLYWYRISHIYVVYIYIYIYSNIYRIVYLLYDRYSHNVVIVYSIVVIVYSIIVVS
jgi:hypothetical protein